MPQNSPDRIEELFKEIKKEADKWESMSLRGTTLVDGSRSFTLDTDLGRKDYIKHTHQILGAQIFFQFILNVKKDPIKPFPDELTIDIRLNPRFKLLYFVEQMCNPPEASFTA